jgi:hypothetical protein
MNTKSTPINQLPMSNGQNTFVNEQQRQMVLQAQNAINNMSLPQNTQTSSDIVNEDDATIQDVLNQINGGTSMHDINDGSSIMNMQMNSMQQPSMPPQVMTPQMTPQVMSQPVIQKPPQPSFEQYMGMGGYMGQYPPQPQQLINLTNHGQEMESDGSIISFISNITDDIKLAAFVFVLFIVVNFIPAEKYLSKYFAIDKIPYYDIIIKALIAFIVVIVMRKIILK